MYKNFQNKYGSHTIKLALTYLLIIMAMSLVFSVVIYNTSVSQLKKPLPGSRSAERGKMFNGRGLAEPEFSDEAREILNERFEDAKEGLLLRLILINMFIFAGGIVFSYYLARRTLGPIEAAMESQSRFVSDASHELRTPLAVIQATNEVALRKPKISDADARKILNQNIAEVERLNNLSDSLLDLLKNQNKIINLVSVNLLDITDQAQEIIKPKSEAKNIKIINNVKPANVKSDFSSAVRILTIYLENAVKYSPAKSKITISSQHKDGKYTINVEDNGPGIKESDIPHIFDRFYRSDSSRTNNEDVDGYGLGLSIAKQVAENINAQLEVQSNIGKGSVFSITFPS
jgi:two-component system sensor histidine kinase CiaH